MAFKTDLRRFMEAAQYLKPMWVDLLSLFIASNFYSAMQLVTPFMVALILDEVLPHSNYQLFNGLILMYMVLIFLMVATSVLKDYVYEKISLRVTFAIRHDLFKHLEGLDLEFHKQSEVGDLITRLLDDVAGIESLLSNIFNDLLTNFIYLVFLLVVCISLSWQMTIVSLVLMPVVVIAQKKYGRTMNKKYAKLRKRDSAYYQYLQERLSMVELTKMFSREFFEFKRHLDRSKDLIKLSWSNRLKIWEYVRQLPSPEGSRILILHHTCKHPLLLFFHSLRQTLVIRKALAWYWLKQWVANVPLSLQIYRP